MDTIYYLTVLPDRERLRPSLAANILLLNVLLFCFDENGFGNHPEISLPAKDAGACETFS